MTFDRQTLVKPWTEIVAAIMPPEVAERLGAPRSPLDDFRASVDPAMAARLQAMVAHMVDRHAPCDAPPGPAGLTADRLRDALLHGDFSTWRDLVMVIQEAVLRTMEHDVMERRERTFHTARKILAFEAHTKHLRQALRRAGRDFDAELKSNEAELAELKKTAVLQRMMHPYEDLCIRESRQRLQDIIYVDF